MALGHPVRQVHRAGEKLFVDYAGQTLSVIDPASGEIRRAQVFVAVLGASNYTYAEATWTQTAADWLGAHCRALAYFGGCPEVVVPDNARALIADPDRYEPALGRAYQEWAAHYGCAVIPARPYRPQDKAKVEVGVQVVERWILARLRTRQCFSLAEVNAAMAALLTELNRRPFKKLPRNGPRPPGRASAFAALDQPALRALPATVFELARWKKARVSIDYHVDIERHYYSVPHQLVGQLIEVRITACMIECLHQGKRVASHVRSHLPGRHTTQAEHMPKSHRAHLEGAGLGPWTPGRLLNWALSIGPATRDIAQYQLESKPHPEMGYRACLGLMRLARANTTRHAWNPLADERWHYVPRLIARWPRFLKQAWINSRCRRPYKPNFTCPRIPMCAVRSITTNRKGNLDAEPTYAAFVNPTQTRRHGTRPGGTSQSNQRCQFIVRGALRPLGGSGIHPS